MLRAVESERECLIPGRREEQAHESPPRSNVTTVAAKPIHRNETSAGRWKIGFA